MRWSCMGSGRAGSRPRSPAVTTANTPGAALAAVTSTEAIRAWAIGELTNTTWAAPSSFRSAT